MGSGLARVPWEQGVGGVGRGEGATGMLAAVGEEGRAARPQGRRGVIEGELSERYEVRPVIASITRKGAQDISNNTDNAFDLAGGVVVVQGAEVQRRAERLVQTRPELLAPLSCSCAVGALTATAFPRRARCAPLCCRSSTQPLLGVTPGATRPSPSQGARCGGRVCRLQWRSTCAPALPSSASQQTTCRLPDFSSPSPSLPVGVAASASTSSNCRWLDPATTSCRCISIS